MTGKQTLIERGTQFFIGDRPFVVVCYIRNKVVIRDLKTNARHTVCIESVEAWLAESQGVDHA